MSTYKFSFAAVYIDNEMFVFLYGKEKSQDFKLKTNMQYFSGLDEMFVVMLYKMGVSHIT